MSSQDLKEVKSQGIKETMSEALDGTVKALEVDLNGGLNTVLDPHNTSANGDKLALPHLDKKAKAIHTPVSSVEASLNSVNSADSKMRSSSINSMDFGAAKVFQSSDSRMYQKKHSARLQITEPKEYSTQKAHGIPYDGTSDDESPSPSPSTTFHSKYRNSGPGLMNLHMFTGKVTGKRPAYVPIYRRNDCGKLLKLVKSCSGNWEYMKLKKLTEEEAEEGLKLLEKPNAKVKKAGGARTLEDYGLPETEPYGGWGWL